jgi:ABC-type antimicrobial peptide transport system permease subunit
MLRDILAQAWEAMLFNRRRTAITTIGMAWGIATVVLLLAYGNGFSHAIETIFAQWGTNTIGFFPGKTSEQAGGDKAGVKVRLTLDDLDRVSAAVPEIIHISPLKPKPSSSPTNGPSAIPFASTASSLPSSASSSPKCRRPVMTSTAPSISRSTP